MSAPTMKDLDTAIDGLNLHKVHKRVHAWFDVEMRELLKTFGARGEGILMGVPVWGKEFIQRFSRHCLPTLGAPENIAALAGRCRLVMYTRHEDVAALEKVTRFLPKVGIKRVIREIPPEMMKLANSGYHERFLVIGCVHNICAHMAARDEMGFHLLMPDHGYGERYFARLFELAKTHKAIVQGGVSTNLEAAAPIFEAHRIKSGAIVLPDRVLGDIAADHLHPESQAHVVERGMLPDGLPHGHRLIWRGRNALHCYQFLMNPAWLAPELCLNAPIAFTTTIDCLLPDFIGDRPFYQPTIDDGMTFIELSAPGKPVWGKPVSAITYAQWVWKRAAYRDIYWPYFRKPMLYPTREHLDAISDEEIAREHAQVLLLIAEHGALKMLRAA